VPRLLPLPLGLPASLSTRTISRNECHGLVSPDVAPNLVIRACRGLSMMCISTALLHMTHWDTQIGTTAACKGQQLLTDHWHSNSSHHGEKTLIPCDFITRNSPLSS
jgi:hypothetical protein